MEEQYPRLADRFRSAFIDFILVILSMFVFAGVLSMFDNVPDFIRILLFVLIFIAYEPLCMTFGATLGNYLMGIRVRQYSDSTRRINIFQAVVRYPVKVLLGWLSFVTIHSNPKRRAIHDMASGSVMIKL